MAINRQKKVEISALIAEKLKGSDSMVFVNFHGLKVAETDAIRRSLRQKGLGYMVAKKSLIRRALADAKIEGTLPELPGEVAMAYGADAVAPAQEMAEFQKQYKERFSMLGGLLEGKFLGKAEIGMLAKTPSRQVLLGKLVNVMYSPVSGFVRTVHAVPTSFVRVLNQIAEKKGN